MAGETARLAQFAHDLRYEDVPPAVLSKAKDILVDQLGVQLGCSGLLWCRQTHQVMACRGGRGDATVVRYGTRLPLPQAMFVNATFGHAFEYDDANPWAHGHPGVELVAASIATAEQEHRSGREMLVAMLAGYEVRGHIGWSVPDLLDRGFPHYSTGCGPISTSAAVGRLLGLNAQQIHDAMGIAGCFCGGLLEYDQSGGSVKRNIGAIAGQGGVLSALLAQAGITGPTEPLEGERGLGKVLSGSFHPERLTQGLGEQWIILQALFKPYTCCAGIHAMIDAVRRLMAEGLRAEDVESIEGGSPFGMFRHVGITEPRDLLGMQFSTSYALSLTMLRGGNTPQHYTEENLHDPEIAAFASRVHIVHDPELDQYWGNHLPGRVIVRTKKGQDLKVVVRDAKGSSGNPMTAQEVDAKFRSMASGVLGEAQCGQLLKQLRAIETVEDVATLGPLLVSHEGQ